MIYENVQLHNVEEVKPDSAIGGVLCQRVPEAIRLQLENAQGAMLMPAGVEIRLVSKGPKVTVTLSAAKLPFGGGESMPLTIFHGDYQHPKLLMVGLEPEPLEITFPFSDISLQEMERRPWAFSPRVLRICPQGQGIPGQLRFHSVEGDGMRPPDAAELPRRRGLVYGSSLSHGFSCTAAHLTYVAQMARRLGVDVCNLGVGASCFCEPAMADYIAGRKDWDFAVLEFSNMVTFGASEFTRRVEYLTKTMKATQRPTFYVSLGFDPAWEASYNGPAPIKELREILSRVVVAEGGTCAHLVEWSEIFDLSGMTPDLLHPADNGMILAGERLATIIKPFLH